MGQFFRCTEKKNLQIFGMKALESTLFFLKQNPLTMVIHKEQRQSFLSSKAIKIKLHIYIFS
jgi:hypothetical protein